jgi:capsular polysaccharide biosynthesis protein
MSSSSLSATSSSSSSSGSEFSSRLSQVEEAMKEPNETKIPVESVGISSLDRLLQLVTANVKHNGALSSSSSIACISTHETTNSTLECEHEDIVPLQDEGVLYVNCAATRNDDDDDDNDNASIHAPLSLLQCRNLLYRTGALRAKNDNVLTVVPRQDIFLASSLSRPDDTNAATLTLPSLAPLGTLHFHARLVPDGSSNNASRDEHGIPSEIQWFANRVLAHRKAPYYAVLGQSLANAYGCVLLQNTTTKDGVEIRYECPTSDPSQSTWTAPESVWDTVRPVMYQWPQQHQLPVDHHGRASATTTHHYVDPVTPSVAVFRHAFCEMETGRLLLHIPQHDRRRASNCSCTPSNETVPPTPTTVHHHRQVLIQLNQCNEPAALASSAQRKRSYAPFKLKVPSTTLARDAGAYRYYDQAIVITAKWSVEYYHTVVEHLPRLLLLRDFILALPDQTMPIVVLQSYRWKTLLQFFAEQWGLGHRLVLVKAKFVVYAETMYIPEPTTCLALQPVMAQAHRRAIRHLLPRPPPQPVPLNGTVPDVSLPVSQTLTSSAHHPVAMANNNNATTPKLALSSDLGTDADTANDWIVVIRRNKTRYLRNHDAMMAALTAALPHEKWYVFDEGKPDGKFPAPGIPQWQVFARAKLVVAPHGAGLANLLACPSNVDVVEMLGEGIDSELCFLHLALALGLRYHPVHMIHPGEGWNYEADIAQVVHVVTSIVQSEERTRRTDSPSLTATLA